jgi:hypothetical protein
MNETLKEFLIDLAKDPAQFGTLSDQAILEEKCHQAGLSPEDTEAVLSGDLKRIIKALKLDKNAVIVAVGPPPWPNCGVIKKLGPLQVAEGADFTIAVPATPPKPRRPTIILGRPSKPKPSIARKAPSKAAGRKSERAPSAVKARSRRSQGKKKSTRGGRKK